MGTADELRRWRDNLDYVDHFQRRNLPDMRTPAEKIHDAGELLELYLSFGYGFADENVAERAERCRTIRAGLAALSRRTSTRTGFADGYRDETPVSP